MPLTSDAGEPSELQVLSDSLFVELDDNLAVNCPCYVEMGAYASVDECVMWLGSRPDSASCLYAALEPHDSPSVRDGLSCLKRQMRASTECLRTRSCDVEDRSSCPMEMADCLVALVQEDPELVIALGMACPDLTLLPRQLEN